MRKWFLILLSVVVLGAVAALPPALMLVFKVAKLELVSEGVVVVPNLQGGAFAVASSCVLALLMFICADLLCFSAKCRILKIQRTKRAKLGIIAGCLIFIVAVLSAGGKVAADHTILAGLMQYRHRYEHVILYILSLAAISPIAEEVLFRGTLLPMLANELGPAWGVAFTSLAFALAHGYGQTFMLYFLAGISFALLVQKERSLLPAILAHATYNGLLIIYLLISG